MNSTRRGFIGGALTASIAAKLWAEEEKPLFRFGTMTDTHIGETVESCGRVKLAFQLFRSKGCDLIINTGDIADHYYPSGYAAYRQVFDEAYEGAADRPRQIFVYAGHDSIGYKGTQKWTEANTIALSAEAFDEVQKHLHAENGHTCTIKYKGYSFVVFPQYIGHKGFIGWDEYEKRIADAVADSPGKPVFVLDHIPAGGVWGGKPNTPRTEILSKFPQVVYFCGHLHGSVRSDLLLWQGKFTAVHSGCLQNWGAWLVGVSERRNAYGVLTVDVHPDRLDIRRWDVRDGSEILPDKPWVVPLPFVEDKAPWRKSVRKAEYAVPQFPSGATVKASAQGKKFKGFDVTIPSAGPKAHKYRLVAFRKDSSGEWKQFTWREVLGDWWLPPKERKAEVTALFDALYFTPGDTVCFSAAPVNPYGVAGAETAKSDAIVVPDGGDRGQMLLESADPAAEFGIFPIKAVGKANRRFKPDADGWYGPFGGEVMIALPPKLFAGKKGTRFRLTLDMESDQPEGAPRWQLRLMEPGGAGRGSEACVTPHGKSGPMRYVIAMTKGMRGGRMGNAETYGIAFLHVSKGRVKPGRLVVERVGGR